MKTENIMLIGLLVLVVGGLIFAFMGFSSDKPSNIAMENKGAGDIDGSSTLLKSIATGSTNSGDVSVELTPHKPDNGKLEVDIAVNTHSVDLSQFDLTKITTLEINGKILKPVSTPKLGGHHSSGTLIFEAEGNVNKFIVKIIGIPKVEERIFEWS